jgi:membrane peptidoglycan carboxypeptidase
MTPPEHSPDNEDTPEPKGPASTPRDIVRNLTAAVVRGSRRLAPLLGEPRTRIIGAVTLALVLLAVSAVLISRTFTVSCGVETACVTLDDLASGAPLPEAIELVDRNGDTWAEVAGPLRRSLETDQISDLVRQAFVAVEDRRFYEHGGVDARGVMRAAMRNVRARGVEEGASTIPMQLVRTLWSESLRDVGPWRRKIIEAFTAPRMIDRLGHEQVLTVYLNAIYMGNGIYGIGRAAQHYFGKSVGELDLGEVATIVGMTQGPERYEPRRHPDRARVRRDVVLSILAAEGIVSQEEAAAARELPIETPPAPELLRQRTYMSAAVTRELRSVAPSVAGTPALRVVTTVDPVIQREGEAALLTQLQRIEDGSGAGTPSPTRPCASRAPPWPWTRTAARSGRGSGGATS